jgi:hypothetical protein
MHAEFTRAEVDRRYVLVDLSGDVEIVAHEVLERLDDGSLGYPS